MKSVNLKEDGEEKGLIINHLLQNVVLAGRFHTPPLNIYY